MSLLSELSEYKQGKKLDDLAKEIVFAVFYELYSGDHIFFREWSVVVKEEKERALADSIKAVRSCLR
ncbi:MAG: hypothetical protein ABH881_01515 [bacterium]